MAAAKPVKRVEESGLCCGEGSGRTTNQLPSSHPTPEWDNTDHFSRLSDEVILQIFKNVWRPDLARLARTCRRFSRIVEDHELWKNETLMLYRSVLNPGTMDIIMRRHRKVKTLRILKSTILSPIFLDDSVASQPEDHWPLVYLDLSFTNLTSESLLALLSRCRQLEELYLEDVADITDEVLKAMAANNKQLRVFSMSFKREVTLAAFRILLKSCSKLRALYLLATQKVVRDNVHFRLLWDALDAFLTSEHSHIRLYHYPLGVYMKDMW